MSTENLPSKHGPFHIAHTKCLVHRAVRHTADFCFDIPHFQNGGLSWKCSSWSLPVTRSSEKPSCEVSEPWTERVYVFACCWTVFQKGCLQHCQMNPLWVVQVTHSLVQTGFTFNFGFNLLVVFYIYCYFIIY